jgi:ankyrin repeat protein
MEGILKALAEEVVAKWFVTGATTPLHEATRHGNLELVKYHLNEGAEVDAKDNDGLTSLHISCVKGFESIAVALIDRGGNVHEKTKAGWTVLHWCVKHGNIKLATVLISKGADIYCKDRFGISVIGVYDSVQCQSRHWPVRCMEKQAIMHAYNVEQNWRRRKAFLIFVKSLKNVNLLSIRCASNSGALAVKDAVFSGEDTKRHIAAFI